MFAFKSIIHLHTNSKNIGKWLKDLFVFYKYMQTCLQCDHCLLEDWSWYWNVSMFLSLGFYFDSFWPVKHLWILTRKEGNWPLEFFLKWIHSFWGWKNSCKTLGCILIYCCECLRQAPVKWLICLTISGEFASLKNLLPKQTMQHFTCVKQLFLRLWFTNIFLYCFSIQVIITHFILN